MGDRNTAFKETDMVEVPLKANAVIEAGKMTAVGADGFGVPASDAAGLKVGGISQEAVDNTGGADGAVSVRVLRNRGFHLLNDGTNAVVAANRFGTVYVKDAQTVSSDGGTNSIVAGKCIDLDAQGVWVEI
ncbi:MAG: hypothetical protein JEZ12_24030 [Desulfobacterium sp.]|nr:hypothetical protein [Desulfobacterium sp.]